MMYNKFLNISRLLLVMLYIGTKSPKNMQNYGLENNSLKYIYRLNFFSRIFSLFSLVLSTSVGGQMRKRKLCLLLNKYILIFVRHFCTTVFCMCMIWFEIWPVKRTMVLYFFFTMHLDEEHSFWQIISVYCE